MKLSIIPAPYETDYLIGYTKATAPVQEHIDKHISAEGFILHIDGTIRLSASTEAGFFYGREALKQIKKQSGQNIPSIHIRDIPRYSYRAFMIDSCRHFFTLDEIKRMITHCAKLRFNVFHWHLTDDQGWRIEIDKYPELTAIGSIRHGSNFGEEQNDEDYGGFYTKADIKDVVDFAHAHHMKVVPEIDMPGHVSALLASIPSLSCTGEKVELKTTAGIFKDTICAGNDENFKILFDILDEVCELFPDEYVHIGGDEAPKNHWNNCPICKAKIAESGLMNSKELQGYFINRVKNYLTEKGKKTITWNESLNGNNLDDDIIVQRWMDPKERCKASPNKIINSDFYRFYADYPYTMTPLKKVYVYDTDINGNVMGIDTPIWTEYIYDIEKMEYMCFPRFIAAAQQGWCKNKPSYKQFKIQLTELLPYFNIENMAPPSRWDPPAKSRVSGIVNHFGAVSKNKKVREFFLNKNSKKK